MQPFNPSLSFVTASYSLYIHTTQYSQWSLVTYIINIAYNYILLYYIYIYITCIHITYKVCSLAFDPSLELVIVSCCTTHNVCIVIHTYVRMLWRCFRQACVYMYLCSSYNLSLVGTDCGGSFFGLSFWVMTREAIEMNSRYVHTMSVTWIGSYEQGTITVRTDWTQHLQQTCSCHPRAVG